MNPLNSSLVLLVSCLAWVTPVRADSCATDTIAPYSIDYQTTYAGMNIVSTRVLDAVADQQYRVGGKAKLFFMGVEEYSTFELDSNNRIRPLQYHYDRLGLGSSKDFQLAFAWDNGQVSIKSSKGVKRLPLPVGAQDALSHQEQLRRDLRCASAERRQQPFVYAVAGRKGIRENRYLVVGEEPLRTRLGIMDAIKLEKQDKGKRKTTFWLAPALDYVALRLKYEEADGSVYQMDIRGGTMNGISIPVREQKSQ